MVFQFKSPVVFQFLLTSFTWIYLVIPTNKGCKGIFTAVRTWLDCHDSRESLSIAETRFNSPKDCFSSILAACKDNLCDIKWYMDTL